MGGIALASMHKHIRIAIIGTQVVLFVRDTRKVRFLPLSLDISNLMVFVSGLTSGHRLQICHNVNVSAIHVNSSTKEWL